MLWAMCLAYDAACLPFGMVGELRRKLSPIALAVLLLFMGVGIMNIRVSAEFPCLRQRAAFCHVHDHGLKKRRAACSALSRLLTGVGSVRAALDVDVRLPHSSWRSM